MSLNLYADKLSKLGPIVYFRIAWLQVRSLFPTKMSQVKGFWLRDFNAVE
jgi:hypothetical protein